MAYKMQTQGWQRRYLKSAKFYLFGAFKRTSEDNCFLYAAGIAFNLLLSVIPLSLLLLEVFSVLLKRDPARTSRSVIRFVTQSIPVDTYQTYIRTFLDKLLSKVATSTHWAGIIGGLTLMWLGSALFSTLRTTLNHIFRFRTKSNSIMLKSLDFLMMLLVMLLFFMLTLIFPVTRVIIAKGTGIFPDYLVALMKSVVPRIISLMVSLAMYFLIFRILPYQKLPRRVIGICAINTVVMVEAMKLVFAFYIQHTSTIGALYGAYALLVAIVLWVYYVSIVITISAEIGWLYWHRAEIESRR